MSDKGKLIKSFSPKFFYTIWITTVAIAYSPIHALKVSYNFIYLISYKTLTSLFSNFSPLKPVWG